MCSKNSNELNFKLIRVEKIPLKNPVWNKGLTAKDHPRVLGGKKSYWYGKKLSKEHKAKLSEAAKTEKRINIAISNLPKSQTGINHPFYGKYHSKETKEKLRLANLGKKQSKETIEKRVCKIRGKKRPDYVKEKISKSHMGKKLSEKTKKKISDAIKNQYKKDPTYALRTTSHIRERNEYNGVYFGSKEEIDAFKILYDGGLIGRPKTGVNVQISVFGILIDFRLNDGSFVEYHPEWFLGSFQPRDEYYEKRRKILDKNGLSDVILYHFTSLNEVMGFVKSRT